MTDQIPLTVSELNARLKIVLEGGLPVLWVRGEVSQFTQHRSGHWYFTLSDSNSKLSCVLWRGRSEGLSFVPQNGQSVVVQGKVTLYERGGRYQFDCFDVRPTGVGELALAFEALKQKLAGLGYFNLERKVPLPHMPDRVGLVTSPEGAALQDILKVAEERSPWVEFLLAPANVQGTGAAADIAEGIKTLDRHGWAQLIIVTRGGGAAEDLWAFNEEVVVRAIANCSIPIVSAVGHEVDVTLADLAADLRAPTPSAAAEICMPDKRALSEKLEDLRSRLGRSASVFLQDKRRHLDEFGTNVLSQRVRDVWRERALQSDDLARRLDSAGWLFWERRSAHLKRVSAHYGALSPLNILSRGYSVVRKLGSLKSIVSAEEIEPEESVDILFHKGDARAVVKSRNVD